MMNLFEVGVASSMEGDVDSSRTSELEMVHITRVSGYRSAERLGHSEFQACVSYRFQSFIFEAALQGLLITLNPRSVMLLIWVEIQWNPRSFQT